MRKIKALQLSFLHSSNLPRIAILVRDSCPQTNAHRIVIRHTKLMSTSFPTYNPKTIDHWQDDSFIEGQLLNNWKLLWEISNWMYFIIQRRFKLWNWPCWCADHLIIGGKGWWRADSLIHMNFQMPHNLQLSRNLLGVSLLKICPTNNRHLCHFNAFTWNGSKIVLLFSDFG